MERSEYKYLANKQKKRIYLHILGSIVCVIFFGEVGGAFYDSYSTIDKIVYSILNLIAGLSLLMGVFSIFQLFDYNRQYKRAFHEIDSGLADPEIMLNYYKTVFGKNLWKE